MRRKRPIPLSLFYLKYFSYIFVGMVLLAAVLLLSFTALASGDLFYLANEGQKQAESAQAAIREADRVTAVLIPELCGYAVFDLNGHVTQGTLDPGAARRAWNALQSGQPSAGSDYYTVIQRPGEYCVLQYRIIPQYKSPALRKHLMPPQSLLLLLGAAGTLLIVTAVAVRFGRAFRKRLAPLTAAVNKIRQQDLEFAVSESGIREIDEILQSMDQMRLALKSALEQQWQLEQAKSRQMSALAHDLKTPLTIVRGNAELLLESELPEAQEKNAAYIENSALQMQNYVQTLIEVTRSWQGYQIHRQRGSARLLFQQIEQQVRGLCAVHRVSLEWSCCCGDRQLSVDRDLFTRAVINVAANAVEHTPPGGSVQVWVTEEGDWLSLVILDAGKGFSREALRHATEQFFMDDASRNSKTHFGIGLYAANSIIHEHGGRLTLENAPDPGGGRVTICIPFS
ncbi:MAG: HAMP domain-containing sensor histidine kinase [Eubacteriales bacterium]|nr:HAMP domain-containing sensor histidine kinase [Eubacteriales bacterium]